VNRNSVLVGLIAAGVLFQVAPKSAVAADTPSSVESRRPIEITVDAPRAANEVPAITFAAPATALRYDPLVDLQERSFGEAQGDLAIRGGTFENSGARIGASPIIDPQTGHYLTEIPFDPRMLTASRRLTGVENAMNGFNHGSGSVAWGLSALQENAYAGRVGFGDFGTQQQSAYLAQMFTQERESEVEFGCDAGLGHSRSNGTRLDGDHSFIRTAARCQRSDEASQTDLLIGYQEKSFEWPYLYALKELHDLVGSSGTEGEALHTTLVLLNHGMSYGSLVGKEGVNGQGPWDLENQLIHSDSTFADRRGGVLEVSPTYRRNRDNYEFDVSQPGLFNPFEHTTETAGVTLQGVHYDGEVSIRYSVQSLYEDLESTALVFSKYHSRARWRGAWVPSYSFLLSERRSTERHGERWRSEVRVGAGVGIDDSNRTSARVSPLAEIVWTRSAGFDEWHSVAAAITQSTQLPGFTALASNPTSGLFRGNATLALTLSTTYELSGQFVQGAWDVSGAVFYRRDRDVVDWTYAPTTAPFAARSADNVDLGVSGTELILAHEGDGHRAYVGHFFLHKRAEYRESVEGSFYALNFPQHRIASALVIEPFERVSLRADVEWREQAPNALRTSSDTTYSLGSMSVTYALAALPGVSVSVLIDNLWKEQFEEVPGVPGYGRTAGVVLDVEL
jgi:hypothetical protein